MQFIGVSRIGTHLVAHPRNRRGVQRAKVRRGRRIHRAAEELKDKVKVVYLENYEMEIARRMVAGVDLWVNNPMKPLEASGTSGMKAALNGVPSLSVLDGWWIEGHVEGVTGWSIGSGESETDQSKDAHSVRQGHDRVRCPPALRILNVLRHHPRGEMVPHLPYRCSVEIAASKHTSRLEVLPSRLDLTLHVIH